MSLKTMRAFRTRQSNRVRRQIEWMLKTDAKYTSPDGLPLWWPLWSDTLRWNVCNLVRAGRALEAAEQHAANAALEATRWCPTCGGRVQVMADGRLIKHFDLRVTPAAWCASSDQRIEPCTRAIYAGGSR